MSDFDTLTETERAEYDAQVLLQQISAVNGYTAEALFPSRDNLYRAHEWLGSIIDNIEREAA